MTAFTGTALILKPTTRACYEHMLESLPPAALRGGDFLVGEPIDHRVCRATGLVHSTYRAFFQAHGANYEAADPITAAEFHAISAADLQAAIQAGSSLTAA